MFRSLSPWIVALATSVLVPQSADGAWATSSCHPGAHRDEPDGRSRADTGDGLRVPARDAARIVVLADNTGGERSGVWPRAVRAANLVGADAVVSIGDMIQGISTSRHQIEGEWDRFDRMTAFDVPFLPVAGNHDVSNATMVEVWNERYGPTYYHRFIGDVLVLVLDTESDGARGVLGTQQVEYFTSVLEASRNHTWTLVFMHRPIWTSEQPEVADEWRQIVRAIGGRYTAVAGHWHRYQHERIEDNDHVVLATSGGGSQLRGPQLGEFDHILLLTASAGGVIGANLSIDHVRPMDYLSSDDRMAREQAVESVDVQVLHPRLAESGEHARLRVRNGLTSPVRISGTVRVQGGDGPIAIDEVLPPGEHDINLNRMGDAERFQTGEVVFVGSVAFDHDGEELVVPIERAGDPLSRVVLDAGSVVVDGDLDEWGEAAWYPLDIGDSGVLNSQYAIRRAADGVAIAVHVEDETIVSDGDVLPWAIDCVTVWLQPRSSRNDLTRPSPRMRRDRDYWRMIVAAPEGTGPSVLRSQFGPPLPDGVVNVARRTETGYVVECFWPDVALASLPGLEGEDWSLLRCNVQVHDVDVVGGLGAAVSAAEWPKGTTKTGGVWFDRQAN